MLFRTLRSQLSRWLWRSNPQHPCTSKKKFIDEEPPRPVTTMPTTLFFYPYKPRSLDADSGLGSSRPPTICTPDSSRSVYFNDAIDWPFIDDDVEPCI